MLAFYGVFFLAHALSFFYTTRRGKFLVWNAVGGFTWVVTVGLAAYYIGHKAESAITALGLVGLLGLVIALIGHGIWIRRSSHPGGRAAGRP